MTARIHKASGSPTYNFPSGIVIAPILVHTLSVNEIATTIFGAPSDMAKCDVCGNDYYLSFEVISAGSRHVFDSFECAIHKLAPVCARCGCKIIGHGMRRRSQSIAVHIAHVMQASRARSITLDDLAV